MSYIRTENGVFKLNDNMRIKYGILWEIYINYEDIFGNKDTIAEPLGEIIAEADTIPVLCDLVRFKTKDGITHYINLHRNTVADIVVHFGGKNIILDSVRYCIETDEGIIYVAKLNDKELVLI